jgi:hypothetical protein
LIAGRGPGCCLDYWTRTPDSRLPSHWLPGLVAGGWWPDSDSDSRRQRQSPGSAVAGWGARGPWQPWTRVQNRTPDWTRRH